MIHSLEIKNFRCFESIEASDLGRINVVVGDNHSGKTAFLEALYLVCGNSPENHRKTRHWRGFGEPITILSSSAVSSGALWRDLFYRFRFSVLVSISIRGTISRSLSIALEEKQSVSVPMRGADVIAPVVFTWKDAKGNASRSVPRLTEREGLQFPIVPVGVSGAMLGPVSAAEVARLYSELDKRNRAQPVLESLRSMFPDIESVSVQTEEAVGQLLYAQVKGMPEKLPLPFISAGINRLLAILVNIETYPRGALFVDEIENGIYFKRLPGMWKTVAEASRRQGTQVFASTHSDEALRALLPTIQGNEADFRLIKLSSEGGQSRIRVVKGADLEAAIEEGVEVR